MREILYRGKRVDNGEWVEGYFTNCYCARIERANGNEYGHPVDYIDVDLNTVGEYTGLTDRNCKKIFEGDIVECYRYANGKDGELVFENLVVVWDDMLACFALAEVGTGHISYRYNEYDMDDTHEFKVIGNIHDNPEQLK